MSRIEELINREAGSVVFKYSQAFHLISVLLVTYLDLSIFTADSFYSFVVHVHGKLNVRKVIISVPVLICSLSR